jgi:hypothetical protein
MHTQPSRRDFVRMATLTLAGATAGSWQSRGTLAAAEPPASRPAGDGGKPLYAFVLLGDLHYDRMAHHDLDWIKKAKGGDLRQIEGYVATTERYTPRLLAEVRRAVADLTAGGVPVPFVLQLGDLVEGLCGSRSLQEQQFRDATAAVDAAAFGVPTLLIKGNHDVTGPGASEAFDGTLLPWLSKQAGQDLRTASYARRQGDDLFVFFDAYKPDLAWLAKTLEAKENAAKRVFFAIHPPVVPYNARADWHVFAREAKKADRDRLLSLLGRYQAVVLSGHLHKYNVLTRRTPEGPFTQLAGCSVVRSEREKPKDVLHGVARYTSDLVDLEPKHAPDTAAARRALLAAEAPFVERFEYADTAGYAVVKAYADRVEADVYAGVGQKAWRTVLLSPLVRA